MSDDSGDSDYVQENDVDEENDEFEAEEENETEGMGSVLPGGHRFDKTFVCVRYPGNVVNPDKAIDTLGGLASISTAVDNVKLRLELRFRPTDGYCKAACADRHAVSGFLLRMRVKKSRISQVEESSRVKSAQVNRNLEPVKLSSLRRQSDDESQTNKPAQDCTTKDPINRTDSSQPPSQPSSCTSDNPALDKDSMKNIPPTFNRHKYEDLSQMEDYELPKLKVLGRVALEYRFQGLCDFQYLPITQNLADPKISECIYDKIYPIGIPPLKWLDNEVPYFLPPAVFSRMDTVHHISMKTKTDDVGPENVIGITRKTRSGTGNYCEFDRPEVPTQPPKSIETMGKTLNDPAFEELRKMFDTRPIWSKNALMYETKFTPEKLKTFLPLVAYHFKDGPWRSMWVRLGFDPRKDPTTRIYQTLDFRVKFMHGLEQSVKGKRIYSNYTLPSKSPWMSKPETTILTNMTEQDDSQGRRTSKESDYIYREGTIPPARQKFYQYHDVLCDEIQEMLAKLPTPPPGTKCDKQKGWLPAGFGDQCREILHKQLKNVLRKKMNIPDNYPVTLPKQKCARRRNSNKDTRKAAGKKASPKKASTSPTDDSDPEWEECN